jgi:hypothetical protein
MVTAVWQWVLLRDGRGPWLPLVRFGFAAAQTFFYVLLLAPSLPREALFLEEDWQSCIDRFNDANRTFLHLWLWLQLLTAVGLSVALIGGEITTEKESGSLALLLTTPLGPGGIVVGKLLSRGPRLLAILWTGLPLYAFAAALLGRGRCTSPPRHWCCCSGSTASAPWRCWSPSGRARRAGRWPACTRRWLSGSPSSLRATGCWRTWPRTPPRASGQ